MSEFFIPLVFFPSFSVFEYGIKVALWYFIILNSLILYLKILRVLYSSFEVQVSISAPDQNKWIYIRLRTSSIEDIYELLANSTCNVNRPRWIYQYSDMATRLSEQTSIFGGVFLVSKSLLGIVRQKKLKKFAI